MTIPTRLTRQPDDPTTRLNTNGETMNCQHIMTSTLTSAHTRSCTVRGRKHCSERRTCCFRVRVTRSPAGTVHLLMHHYWVCQVQSGWFGFVGLVGSLSGRFVGCRRVVGPTRRLPSGSGPGSGRSFLSGSGSGRKSRPDPITDINPPSFTNRIEPMGSHHPHLMMS